MQLHCTTSTHGVYRITHLVSGTTYIGSTALSFHKRWGQHRRGLGKGIHHNLYLQYAWNKYGPSAFEWAILEETDAVVEREQYHLDAYRVQGVTVYNQGIVAASPNWGCQMSEEQKAKIAQAHQGRSTMTEEGRASLRAFRTGRKATDEQRAARSLARTGKPQSLETILKRSLALRGRKLTPEHIKKHADLLRGRPVSLEHADHLRKNALAMAKEYPALVNMRTGEAIPLGWNIKEMCRVQGLDSGNISRLINGIRKQYKGWHVAGVVK